MEEQEEEEKQKQYQEDYPPVACILYFLSQHAFCINSNQETQKTINVLQSYNSHTLQFSFHKSYTSIK